MIYSAKELERFQIAARDGLLGTVYDIFFDERAWLARYFAISTGPWLNRRHVLLAAPRLRISETATRSLSTDATQKQVRESPSADLEQPLTRQQEHAMHDHYGWPYYWSLAAVGSGVTPFTAGTTNALSPTPPASTPPSSANDPAKNPLLEPALRSVRELRGYSIAAADDLVGEIDDVLFDHVHWQVRYLVIDTHKWLPGPKVLVSPQHVREVRPARLEITVELTREQIKHGPSYDPGKERTGDYNDRLYDFYGRSTQ